MIDISNIVSNLEKAETRKTPNIAKELARSIKQAISENKIKNTEKRYRISNMNYTIPWENWDNINIEIKSNFRSVFTSIREEITIEFKNKKTKIEYITRPWATPSEEFKML